MFGRKCFDFNYLCPCFPIEMLKDTPASLLSARVSSLNELENAHAINTLKLMQFISVSLNVFSGLKKTL